MLQRFEPKKKILLPAQQEWSAGSSTRHDDALSPKERVFLDAPTAVPPARCSPG